MSLEEYHKIYSKVPRAVVECIIKSDKGVLLTKRAIEPFKGLWHLPGGTIGINETIEDAVKRVAKEEVNLEVEVGTFLGIIDWFNYAKLGEHTISLCYEIIKFSGEIKLDYQATEAKFFQKIPRNTIKNHYNFLRNL